VDCPKGHGPLSSVEFGGIHILRCRDCGGAWYDAGELRLLKDREASGDYCWIDLDLWKDIDKFRAARQQRYRCPRDGSPLTTVHYGDSSIAVDICSECKGVWLDEAEYKRIIAYLETVVSSHTVGDYLKDLRDEFVELFAGPETPWSELKDFDRVLYLLELRFIIEHPTFRSLLNSLPRF
jgi:Zn-finger nucleic acid-binding protein